MKKLFNAVISNLVLSLILTGASYAANSNYIGATELPTAKGKISLAKYNWTPYLTSLDKKIASVWKSPGTSKPMHATVSFTLRQDGKIMDYIITQTSGDYDFDDACTNTFKLIDKFPPMPETYKNLYFPFEYTFKSAR